MGDEFPPALPKYALNTSDRILLQVLLENGINHLIPGAEGMEERMRHLIELFSNDNP